MATASMLEEIGAHSQKVIELELARAKPISGPPKKYVETYKVTNTQRFEDERQLLNYHFYSDEDIDIDPNDKKLCYVLRSGFIQVDRVAKVTNKEDGKEDGAFHLTRLTDKEDLKLRKNLLRLIGVKV